MILYDSSVDVHIPSEVQLSTSRATDAKANVPFRRARGAALVDAIIVSLLSICLFALATVVHNHNLPASLRYTPDPKLVLFMASIGLFAGAIGFGCTYFSTVDTNKRRSIGAALCATVGIVVLTTLYINAIDGRSFDPVELLRSAALGGLVPAPMGWRCFGTRNVARNA